MRRELMPVHGTYPHDTGKWKTVRNLTLQEAADLVGTTVTPEEVEDHESSTFGSVYFWINKGFVVIGRSELQGAPSNSLGLACMEMFCTPEHKDIQVGDQAVYIHDGSYTLIERVEK